MNAEHSLQIPHVSSFNFHDELYLYNLFINRK